MSIVVVDVNHVDILGSQTALFYAAREGHCEMCKALVEAGCNVAHQDASHKMASHYAKKFGNNETYEYLSFELQNIKDAKKVPVESKQESNNEDQQKLVKRKKRENLSVVTQQVKTSYRLYRADCLGNATELNQQ